MQAVGHYSGVPQDEPTREYQSQNLPKKHHVPVPVKTATLLGFCAVTVSIFSLVLWTALPGNRRDDGDLHRRDELPIVKHYIRATSDPSADNASTPITSDVVVISPSTTQTSDEGGVTATTNPDAFVPLKPTTTITAGSTTSDAFIPLDPSPAETESTATSAFIPLDPSEKTATAPGTTALGTTAPDAFIPLGPSGSPVTKPTAGTFVITTNVPGGTAVVAATVTGTLRPSEPLLFTATGSNIPGGILVITKSDPLVANPTATAKNSGGMANSAYTIGDPPEDSFAVYNGRFTVGHYFLGAYFPTLLAVVYGILWNTILSGITEITPFLQLTRSGGATAKESLFLEYQNASLWHLLVSSIKHHNGLVFAGTMATLIITAAIALAAEVFYIGISGTCRETGKGSDCTRYLGINRNLAWAECGMLLIILVVVAFVIFAMRKRNTGLFAEATSIAGIATLMSNPQAVARIREALEDRRFLSSSREATFGIGRSYDEASGWTYGFTVLENSKTTESKDAEMVMFEEDPVKENSNVLPFLLLPAMIIVFELILLGLLTIILYYWFNGSPSALEDFMNSQTFGPKLMMSCFGIVIRVWWSEISRAVHTIEPYRRLVLGQATPHESLLAPTSSHAVSTIFTALTRRHFFAAFVALLTVLSEVLIVTLAAIPFNLATLLDAFRISVFISVGIIGLMIATLPFVLLRYKDSLIGPPSCIADTVKLLMNPGNEVVHALGGMGELKRAERDAAIEGLRRRYRFTEQGGAHPAKFYIVFEREDWVA